VADIFSSTEGLANDTRRSRLVTTNDRPIVSAAGSALVIQPGESVSFTSTSNDPNNDTLTISWDFADGTTSALANPTHTYTSSGTYTAVLNAFDGMLSATSAVEVKVLQGRPAARFTTSDVVAFVGVPLTFDAALSTDPENSIAAYRWVFGDGSPEGAGQVISKIYQTQGTYSASLTVSDRDGHTSSVSRTIVVLPADQAGLFNAFITFKIKSIRTKADADSLQLNASINIGAATVSAGDTIAVGIAGQTFTAQLDPKLRSKTTNAMWKVDFATRKLKPGEVRIQARIKKANLGASLALAGVVPEGDGKDSVDIALPVRIEVGTNVFEVAIDSSFDFAGGAARISGDGNGP